MVKDALVMGAGGYGGLWAYNNFAKGKIGGGNAYVEIALMIAAIGAGAYAAKKLF